MKFKELFGSFTDHRDEKRTTVTRNGSTGSEICEKQKTGNGVSSPTTWRAVGDALG
ncbi:hypothetical protein Hanom_Chr09g00840441 [Helianthus anomalus]